MQVGRKEDERHVDRGQVVGEPSGQEDVGHRTVFGTERLGDVGQGTAESVRREDQGLAAHHDGRDRGTPIGAAHEPRIQQVHHAALDGEPGKGVDDLDRDERAPVADRWIADVMVHGHEREGTRRPARSSTTCSERAAGPCYGQRMNPADGKRDRTG